MNRTASAGPIQPAPIPENFLLRLRKALPVTYLIASLQVKVTGLGVETQVNAIAIISNDVFGPWVLAIAPAH